MSEGRCEHIGIVIPAYRCERWIAATIRSLLLQTHQDWECVVVDDGSPDATFEAARQAAAGDRRIRVIRQANARSCAARNNGYRNLSERVRFVSFMDADDCYHPSALERLLFAGRRDGVIGSHGLAEFVDAEGVAFSTGEFASIGRSRLSGASGRMRPLAPQDSSDFASILSASTIFPPGLVLTRRDVLDKVGVFDDRLKRGEDWDILIRSAREGAFAFVDDVLLHYRRHDHNEGAQVDVPLWTRRVFHKAFHSHLNTPEQQRICRHVWSARQRMIADIRAVEARQALRRGRLAEAAERIARVPIIHYRRLRGRPTLHGWSSDVHELPSGR